MKPLNAKERKLVHEQLIQQYGYTGIFDYIVFTTEERKYYVATRNVEQFLNKNMRIERLGMYFGQDEHNELRLSIEGSQMIGPQATHHVLELTTPQRDEWMLGKDIILNESIDHDFYIIRHGDDYMGSGKVKHGVLLNFVPKERYVGATFTDDDTL